jgi:uncharacterized membrane protein YGL010W
VIDLRAAIADFSEHHRSRANRVCHYLGLPAIAAAVLGGLARLELPLPLAPGRPVDGALVLLVLTFLFDLTLNVRIALGVLAFGGGLYVFARPLGLEVLGALFVMGWTLQLVGHRVFEGNAPAFTKNLFQLVIGPRWLVNRVFRIVPDEGASHSPLTKNDVAAQIMLAAIPVASALATRMMARRIARFARAQQVLRRRYGITAATPVTGYDEEARARVRAFVAASPGARIATTSGTTGAPKEIAYTRARLRQYKRDSVSIALRTYARYRVRAPGMFILASLKDDDSFAALVLHQRRSIGWLAGLAEPSRYLSHPAVAPLLREHGLTAVRLWLMAVSNPGMLYATNPSTLAAFFHELVERWPESSSLARRFVAGDPARDPLLAPTLRGVIDRVGAADWRARLREVAASPSPLPCARIMPALTAWCAWDGGYVKAFLPEVHRHLPEDRYAHLPMYSMSTETIETLTWFDDTGTPRFLPLGPHVLYELLPEGADDRPDLLLPATAAKPGGVYAMVVSDRWGLRRYQTDDLFLCEGIVRGLPDLRFLRRRGLAWSFTGEKITGEQLALAFDELRRRFAALAAGVELVCFPSHPEGALLPGYQLIVAPTLARRAEVERDLELASVASSFDEIMCDLNTELAAKLASGRLAPTRAGIVPHEALAIALDRRTRSDDDIAKRAWESQFKLTPLVKKRWEEIAPALTP